MKAHQSHMDLAGQQEIEYDVCDLVHELLTYRTPACFFGYTAAGFTWCTLQ